MPKRNRAAVWWVIAWCAIGIVLSVLPVLAVAAFLTPTEWPEISLPIANMVTATIFIGLFVMLTTLAVLDFTTKRWRPSLGDGLAVIAGIAVVACFAVGAALQLLGIATSFLDWFVDD